MQSRAGDAMSGGDLLVVPGSLSRWIGQGDNGRIFVAYCSTRFDAIELFRKAEPTVHPDTVRQESEAEGREWERSALASRFSNQPNGRPIR